MQLSKEFKDKLNMLTNEILTNITKEDINQVKAGAGGNFSYLPLDTLLKIAAVHGFITTSTIDNGFMITSLVHKDFDGEISTSMPTTPLDSLNDGKGDNHNKKMQQYGLSFTYLRRYSLYNLLGVTMADVLELSDAKQQKTQVAEKKAPTTILSDNESVDELVAKLTAKPCNLSLNERYKVIKVASGRADATKNHISTMLNELNKIKEYLIEKSSDTEKVDSFIGVLEEKLLRFD